VRATIIIPGDRCAHRVDRGGPV